jgi:WD40 repeat protein
MSSSASLPPLLSRYSFDASTPAASSYLQVCGDDSVKLWSVAGASVIKQFLLPAKAAATITAHAITSFDAKGKKKGQQQRTLIAVGTATGAVVLFDATAGECKWNVRDSSATGAVTACAIDAACSRIFSAATDCSLVARSLDDGSAQLSFKVGKHHAACVAVSPDGSQLVAAGAFIKLFSVASQVLQPPKNEPLSLTLSPRRPCCADTPPRPPLSPKHRSALAVRSRLSS